MISLLTCEKVIRNNDYFKLIFLFSIVFLNYFINCIWLRGVPLILQLYTYFLINRMNRSSQCLKLSLFIGPGIYILATEFAQGKDLWKYYGTH